LCIANIVDRMIFSWWIPIWFTRKRSDCSRNHPPRTGPVGQVFFTQTLRWSQVLNIGDSNMPGAG